MIQFNLLPDVKLEYIRAQQLKRTVLMSSIGVAATTFVIFVLLFIGVVVFQKQHLTDLSNDIRSDSSKLQSTEDLNKILTIQNQLGSLTDLNNNKPVTSRLVGYIQQITPAKVEIASLSLDFTASTITLNGSADAISTVNQFVDTLKFTTYLIAGSQDQKPAFSKVVLTSFNQSPNSTTYAISFSFDPTIFQATQSVTLVVPNQVTTRSETEKPTDLFAPNSTSGISGGSQ